ncbi:MAG: methyltransferase domain-containing protein [Proteobacteria bacterium]|nr:methyltransferase domain-containing protein [Pseudomonadota bacterium]
MTIQTPDDIQKLAGAFMRSRIVLTGWDLGVFTALGHGWCEAGAVAEEIGADARATDRLLGALCVLGLVEKKEGKFRNTDVALRWLDADSPDYLSGLGHLSNLYENWGTLTESVRQGGTVLDPDFDNDAKRAAFIEAMHRRAKKDAGELVGMLDLSKTDTVLDVGGGSGVYSMAMCRVKTGLKAVVFDLEPVTKLTQNYVEQGGFSGRITTKPGDYLRDDFGSGYDLAFFSAIVHINNYEENGQLMRSAFAALNPGGQVAVVDFVMDEARLEPEFGAIFALNMLVNTRRGDVFTEGEITNWFADAGFVDITRKKTGPTTAMMLGRKPQ